MQESRRAHALGLAKGLGWKIYEPHAWSTSRCWRRATRRELAQLQENLSAGASCAEFSNREILLSGSLDDVGPYWTALHELGHAATLPAQVPDIYEETSRDTVIRQEQGAWQWAVAQSIEPITASAAFLINDKLHSYLDQPVLPIWRAPAPWIADPGTVAVHHDAVMFLDDLTKLALAA